VMRAIERVEGGEAVEREEIFGKPPHTGEADQAS